MDVVSNLRAWGYVSSRLRPITCLAFAKRALFHMGSATFLQGYVRKCAYVRTVYSLFEQNQRTIG